MFQNSESSFTIAPAVEEELQQLREKLTQAESSNRTLQHQLWEAEQRVREEGHAEQVCIIYQTTDIWVVFSLFPLQSFILSALQREKFLFPPPPTQVRVLQAVVKEKDVRFQDQILKHEQEILSLTQTSNDNDLQQVTCVWAFTNFKKV